MANKSIRLTIPFPSKITANLFFDVLNVDNEPKRSEVTKNISVDGDNVIINLHGKDYKKLRVSVNGVLKSILLISKTVDLFKS